MSRYRPPAKPKSPYITREGYRTLLDEQQRLWLKRREVVSALSDAAAEGDRSENAEYIYRKKELREIDRRIHYLQKRLPDLTVVDRAPDIQTTVFFGARLTLENEHGNTKQVRIVGCDEIDAAPGHISVDSPLAQALLKKNLDDEVTVSTPTGQQVYWIINIHYAV